MRRGGAPGAVRPVRDGRRVRRPTYPLAVRPLMPSRTTMRRVLAVGGVLAVASLAVASLALWLLTVPPTGAHDVPPSDPVTQRLGAGVYRTRCAACHGVRGEGAPNWKTSGPDGRLPPPPHDSTGHTWHHADGLLYRIVSRGMARALGETRHPSRYGMPAFDSTLTPREVHAVITYLKDRWTPAQRRRQAEASRGDPFPAAALPP